MSIFDGVMIGSDCADFWEKRNKEYHQELEEYVLENPGLFGILVATSKATAADFAMVMWVDLARLGEGFAQGGVKGVVQDVFRVMSFIPQGKVLQGHKSWIGQVVQRVANIRIWRECRGGLCVPISFAQALQRGGYRIGVGLSEIADAIGLPLRTIFKEGTSWNLIEKALGQLGLQFTKLISTQGGLSTFKGVVDVVQTLNAPILLRIESSLGGHAILIGKTLTGIKIIDRYGIFRNLDDLARHYNVASWTIDSQRPMFAILNAVVDEKLISLAKKSDVLAVLVRHSLAVFDLKVSKAEVEADFEKFLQRKGSRKITLDDIPVSGGMTVEVKRGDLTRSTLSGISKHQYGEFTLWPLIYDLNRDKIGPNPNQLKQGMKLLVLPLARYSPQEQSEARRRSHTWKHYT